MCVSVSHHLKDKNVANTFSSDLETHKSQIFPMVAHRSVAKLSTSHEVTIFPPPVPYLFISDHFLKGDRWTTLFLRNLIVAMDFQNLQTHKIWIILRGEPYVNINLLASTRLLLYRFKYICKQKILQILEYCFPNNYFGKFLFLQISKIHSLQKVFRGYRPFANCRYSNN